MIAAVNRVMGWRVYGPMDDIERALNSMPCMVADVTEVGGYAIATITIPSFEYGHGIVDAMADWVPIGIWWCAIVRVDDERATRTLWSWKLAEVHHWPTPCDHDEKALS